jgi:hypothetical protein
MQGETQFFHEDVTDDDFDEGGDHEREIDSDHDPDDDGDDDDDDDIDGTALRHVASITTPGGLPAPPPTSPRDEYLLFWGGGSCPHGPPRDDYSWEAPAPWTSSRDKYLLFWGGLLPPGPPLYCGREAFVNGQKRLPNSAVTIKRR